MTGVGAPFGRRAVGRERAGSLARVDVRAVDGRDDLVAVPLEGEREERERRVVGEKAVASAALERHAGAGVLEDEPLPFGGEHESESCARVRARVVLGALDYERGGDGR